MVHAFPYQRCIVLIGVWSAVTTAAMTAASTEEASECGSLTPRLHGIDGAVATCNDRADPYSGYLYQSESESSRSNGNGNGNGNGNAASSSSSSSDGGGGATTAAAPTAAGPVIPPPSETCGGGDVVVGWCLQDAPLSPHQPPLRSNWSDAECCAACVEQTGCVAWNTNQAQQGTAANGCHFRGGVGTPNAGKCHFGIVRSPPPPPPAPPAIKPAPNGAKNLLVIVCDDFRPTIKPFTDRYNIKAPNLEKLAASSMVFNNTYVSQAVCGPSRNSFMTGKR